MRVAIKIGAGIIFVILLVLSGGLALILNPAEDEGFAMGYDVYSPMRTLTLTSKRDVIDVVAPLRQWAIVNGYKTQTGSPTGRAESILFRAWNGSLVIGASERTGPREPSGLWLWVYWNGDSADDAALDRVAGQMAGLLAGFGPVRTISAPPGTPPRAGYKNFWTRSYLFRLFSAA